MHADDAAKSQLSELKADALLWRLCTGAAGRSRALQMATASCRKVKTLFMITTLPPMTSFNARHLLVPLLSDT